MSQSRHKIRSALATVALCLPIVSFAGRMPTIERSPYGILPAAAMRHDSIQIGADQALANGPWSGLVCSDGGCQLRPVTLRIESDGNGHRICVQKPRKPIKGEFTVAFLAGFSKSALPVVAAFTPRTRRNSDDVSNGSLGVSIAAANGGYRFLPRWDGSAKLAQLTIYLETAELRQPLGTIELTRLNDGLRTRDLLVWAGDLDGDGKLDLITHFGTSGGLELWLSKLAAPGELVGRAASLKSWTDIDEAEGC
jgi:hypothetical protein